ncbi:MAG TPA: DUF4345 family protein [Puia sp.]|nr:DUF4345 family protein [Puia sp.]
MDKLSNFGIWFNRAILLLVAFLFTMIATRNLLHPAASAAESNITLSSATAFSVARVSMGAIPLAVSISVFLSIFSKKRILAALLFVFILITIVTMVRIVSLNIDGHSEFGERVLIPEITIMVLSAIGLYLELRRRKKSGESD